MKRDTQFDLVIEQVAVELATCLGQTSNESMAQAAAMIATAQRIFLAGAGRSGLCMRAFGMRLMQLGKTAFIVGETTTPSITAVDLLIIGSGSGRTGSLLAMAQKARQQGAQVLLLTANALSPLVSISDHLVTIPAPLPGDASANSLTSVQPLGTLFEQCLLIWCDTLILALMQQMNVSEAQMAQRHANLQ